MIAILAIVGGLFLIIAGARGTHFAVLQAFVPHWTPPGGSAAHG